MKKWSNIGAAVCFVMIIASYILFSFNLEILGVKLNILYALTSHIAFIIIALIFLVESKSNIVKLLSIYTVIFFTLAIILFIYVGILENKSYFSYKLCIYLSIILTGGYEAVSFIRKYAINNRHDFGIISSFFVFYRSLFLQKSEIRRVGKNKSK